MKCTALKWTQFYVCTYGIHSDNISLTQEYVSFDLTNCFPEYIHLPFMK